MTDTIGCDGPEMNTSLVVQQYDPCGKLDLHLLQIVRPSQIKEYTPFFIKSLCTARLDCKFFLFYWPPHIPSLVKAYKLMMKYLCAPK